MDAAGAGAGAGARDVPPIPRLVIPMMSGNISSLSTEWISEGGEEGEAENNSSRAPGGNENEYEKNLGVIVRGHDVSEDSNIHRDQNQGRRASMENVNETILGNIKEESIDDLAAEPAKPGTQQMYGGEEPGGGRTLLEMKKAGTYDANIVGLLRAGGVPIQPGAYQVYGEEELVSQYRASGVSTEPGAHQVYSKEESGAARTLFERKEDGTYDANIVIQARQARSSGNTNDTSQVLSGGAMDQNVKGSQIQGNSNDGGLSSSEKIQAPLANDEQTNLGALNIGLDDVLMDLQQYKEEHGNVNVPLSHPAISLFFKKMSSLGSASSGANNVWRGVGSLISETLLLLDNATSMAGDDAPSTLSVQVGDDMGDEEDARGTATLPAPPPDIPPMPPRPRSVLSREDGDSMEGGSPAGAEEGEPRAGSLAQEISSDVSGDDRGLLYAMDRFVFSQTQTSTEHLSSVETTESAPPDPPENSMDDQRHPSRLMLASSRVMASFSTVGRSLGRPFMVPMATLVEELQVVEAEPVHFSERNWKHFVKAAMFLLLAATVAGMVLLLTDRIQFNGKGSPSSTLQPSSSPTFDPRPTLEIVQSRGNIRCGMKDDAEGVFVDLCRSVAAVLVGNPLNFEHIPVTVTDKWQRLHDRSADLLLSGDTHNIEREVREPSTGVGFTFTTPYNYDGMVFFGNETFVRCAEKQRRFDKCSTLMICVARSTTHSDYVKRSFPSEHVKFATSNKEKNEMLFNNTCNVAVADKSQVNKLGARLLERNFIAGDEMMTNEPLAIVTRTDDREFSDAINWVLRALFRGEERGLVADASLCKNHVGPFPRAPDLDFMNAVHCVGNYGEILGGGPEDRARNRINNGTGMLYAIPFGNLDKENAVDPSSGGTLAEIKDDGSLACGVVVPNGFEGNVAESDGIVGMSVDYCRMLAAALLVGDSDNVKFVTFAESDTRSFFALDNGRIDVLVGGKVQRKYDFQQPPRPRGFYFTTPYYYGDEPPIDDVSFYAIATREDDSMFSSFVNCIILATIYAQKNEIKRKDSIAMPLVSAFGSELYWALRDAISHSGNYEEIYIKNFGARVSDVAVNSIHASGFSQTAAQFMGPIDVAQYVAGEVYKATRGRNALNNGGPMLLSLPDLPDRGGTVGSKSPTPSTR